MGDPTSEPLTCAPAPPQVRWLVPSPTLSPSGNQECSSSKVSLELQPGPSLNSLAPATPGYQGIGAGCFGLPGAGDRDLGIIRAMEHDNEGDRVPEDSSWPFRCLETDENTQSVRRSGPRGGQKPRVWGLMPRTVCRGEGVGDREDGWGGGPLQLRGQGGTVWKVHGVQQRITSARVVRGWGRGVERARRQGWVENGGRRKGLLHQDVSP